jgi:hypothetical protein
MVKPDTSVSVALRVKNPRRVSGRLIFPYQKKEGASNEKTEGRGQVRGFRFQCSGVRKLRTTGLTPET